MNVPEKPKISVIIPVYNGEKTLDRCLQSVTGQSYENLEIIVVDDGSTDKTKSICEYWAKRDHRIKVFHKELDHVCEARNLGLSKVTGDYISWVDADDYLEADMYTAMMGEFDKNSEADIVVCRATVHYPDGKVDISYNTSLSGLDGKEAIRRIIVNAECSALWNKLFKMDLVRQTQAKFERISGKYSEDCLWMMELFCCAKQVVSIDAALYHYILSNTSTSRGQTLTNDRLTLMVNGAGFLVVRFNELDFTGNVREDILFKIRAYICYLQYIAYINELKEPCDLATALLQDKKTQCRRSDPNDLIFKEIKCGFPKWVVRVSHKFLMVTHLIKEL